MHPSIRRFIDDEAREENAEDDEDEEHDLEGKFFRYNSHQILLTYKYYQSDQFINDVTEDENSNSFNINSAQANPENAEKALESFLEGVLERTEARRLRQVAYRPADGYDRWAQCFIDEPINYERIGGDESFLWRIECRVSSHA